MYCVAYLSVLQVPIRSMLITFSTCSSVSSQVFPKLITPAFAITTSKRPNFSHAFANRFSISGVLQMFALTAKTSAPNSFNSLMVSWNLSSSGSSISARTTLNPFCAYLTAWARPCPIAPPVINTVFFCSLMTFFPFHFFKWFKCVCYFFNLLICHYYNN